MSDRSPDRHRDGRRWIGLVLLVVLALGGGPAIADEGTPVLADAPPASWPAPDGIDSAAHLLMEVETGQLLVAHNADQRRPVASTLKLLTAYTALQRVEVDEVVTVGEEVLGVTGSTVGLVPGDEWTVGELLDAILARSGNEAAEALAVHVAGDRATFLSWMEEDAAGLGAEGLTITTPSGLDDDTVLSARDLALIARAALDLPALRDAMGKRLVALPGQPAQENRNELIGTYPGATGMKTGFTTPAGHSLVGSAERGGRELIAIVLGAGEDPSRFEGAASLLDHGFTATRPTELGASVSLSVGGGTIDLVTDDVTITIPIDSEARLDLRLPLRPPETSLRFPLVVDDATLTELVATPGAGPEPVDDPNAQLGRSLVDGTYTALRAATAAGTLG